MADVPLLKLDAAASDGQVPTADGLGGYAWETPSGGGGSGQTLPIDTFASVGSGDDFGGSTLDAGWTSLQSTALTSVDASVDDFVILKNTGNTAGQHRGIQRAFSPAGDFEVIAKMNVATLIADYQWAGIFIGAANPSNGAGGNRLDFFPLASAFSGGVANVKAAKYAAGVETSVIAATPLATAFNLSNVKFDWPLWLRIKRVGSTISFGLSVDGVQFIDHATTTTISFTVGTLGLLLAESTATANMRATFDYIRTA